MKMASLYFKENMMYDDELEDDFPCSDLPNGSPHYVEGVKEEEDEV